MNPLMFELEYRQRRMEEEINARKMPQPWMYEDARKKDENRKQPKTQEGHQQQGRKLRLPFKLNPFRI